jgi:polyketide cyclase/dehydrase/lipid transport protein
MIRIETSHTFPIPVGEAFAYITDMKNWPDYWPDFVRIEDPARAHWGQRGDAVTIVIKLLNRERALNMKLEEFEKDKVVTYRSHQTCLPDALHERHFRAIPGGFEYRLVVVFEPRPGLRGLIDRLLVKRAIARALHKTIENLDRVFKHQKGSD